MMVVCHPSLKNSIQVQASSSLFLAQTTSVGCFVTLSIDVMNFFNLMTTSPSFLRVNKDTEVLLLSSCLLGKNVSQFFELTYLLTTLVLYCLLGAFSFTNCPQGGSSLRKLVSASWGCL